VIRGEGAAATVVDPVVVLATSLLLLPIVVFDMVRFTNRLVGPMVRLRTALRCLCQGRPCEPLRFRHGDFWTELAEEFNALAARVQASAPGDFDGESRLRVPEAAATEG
jgi:hypothetical protein